MTEEIYEKKDQPQQDLEVSEEAEKSNMTEVQPASEAPVETEETEETAEVVTAEKPGDVETAEASGVAEAKETEEPSESPEKPEDDEKAEASETATAEEPSEPSEKPEDDETVEVPDGAESMESMLSKYGVEEIHKGKVVTGTVVEKNQDGWLVDVGYKCEGFLPTHEWTHRILVEEVETPSINDEIQVQVINVKHGEESQLIVSRWRCEFDNRWQALEEKAAAGEPFSVRGLRKVKGGLMVDCCSLEGFVPISHLAEEGRGVNPTRFVDDVFDVTLLEKDRRKRRLVLSRRALIEDMMADRRKEFFEERSEGDVVEGTVSSITSFGAFINLDCIDGLVHASELSWKRDVKPRDVLKKGETVTVKIIGLDREKGRVSLSIKQTLPDPWESVSEQFQEGETVTGKVTNVTDFGVFVEVAAGIEGLIHIGDLSWRRIRHPKEILSRGQEVEAKILNIDTEKQRMSLGYKQLHDPWIGIEDKYTRGQDLTVKVVRLADFGAFVEIEEGIEGLIHISQLSTRRVETPGEVLSRGQEIEARIIEINPPERKMRLSISAIEGEDDKKKRAEERKKRESEAKKRQAEVEEENNITIGDVLGDFLKN